MPVAATHPPSVRSELAALVRASVAAARSWMESKAAAQPREMPPGLLPTPYQGTHGDMPDWDVGAAVKANTGHVYSAVAYDRNAVLRIASTMRLVVKREATARRPAETERVENHWLLDLWRNPNELDLAGPLLTSDAAGWQRLTGNAYLAKIRGTARRPEQLVPLIPDRIRVVRGRTRPIEAFNYYPDGGTGGHVFGFPREDVIFMKDWSPIGHIFGWSPLRAGLAHKALVDKSLQLRLAQFENRARFDYAMAPPLPTDPRKRKDAIKRLRAALEIHHGGIDKSGKPLLVPPGTEFHELSASAEAVQLVQQIGLLRDDVFEFYGQSPILHGHHESAPARANKDAELYDYALKTLSPLMIRMRLALQCDLVDAEANGVQLRGRRLELEHDNPVPADKAHDQTTALKGWESTLLDAAAAKRLLGIDPADGDEERFMQKPGMALGDARITADYAVDLVRSRFPDAPEALLDAVREIQSGGDLSAGTVERLSAVLTKAAAGASLPEAASLSGHHPREGLAAKEAPADGPDLDTEDGRTEYWTDHAKAVDAEERRGFQLVRAAFAAQAKRVLPELEAALPRIQDKFAGWSRGKKLKVFSEIIRKDDLDDLGVWGEEERARELEQVASDLLVLLRRSLVAGSSRLSTFLDFDTDYPESDLAQEWLASHSVEAAGIINRETRRLLAEAVRDGVAEGESTAQIAARARRVFADEEDEDIARYRSFRVARTEVGAAFGEANQRVMEEAEEAGVADEKVWITARDGDVRSAHQIDGEVVGIKERFSNGMLHEGDMSVDDPSLFINDRCTTAPRRRRAA